MMSKRTKIMAPPALNDMMSSDAGTPGGLDVDNLTILTSTELNVAMVVNFNDNQCVAMVIKFITIANSMLPW